MALGTLRELLYSSSSFRSSFFPSFLKVLSFLPLLQLFADLARTPTPGELLIGQSVGLKYTFIPAWKPGIGNPISSS